jgi:8-oxo-dGTP pyrophosphatase MutT (NUDIX family)
VVDLVIDKLAWIHVVGRRILSTRSHGKDTYYIPGGKREGSETDHQALIREIKEELSVDLRPETISYFGQFEAPAHGHAAGIQVCMTCYTAEYDGVLQPAAEIAEMVWLQHRDRDRSSPVDRLIFDVLHARGLLV